MPIIPATQEVHTKGSWFEASQAKVSELLSQNQAGRGGAYL
jgi:hypothetical protein